MAVRSVRLVLVSAVVASCAIAGLVPIALAGGGANPASGPQQPQAGNPASHRLVLKISQDRYRGNAKYLVRVDGSRVGGIRTARASHRLRKHDVVRLSGHWGPGSHTVTVKFLNDRYDGTPRQDRNLYVDGAKYDGKRVKGARQAVRSERWPAEFTVTDTVGPSPASTPTATPTANPSETFSATPEPSATTSATAGPSAAPPALRCTSTISTSDDLAGAVATSSATGSSSPQAFLAPLARRPYSPPGTASAA